MISAMKNINTDELKKRLEQELKTLEAELKTVGHKNPDNPRDWEPDAKDVDNEAVEDGDIAEGITEYESNTAVLKQLEAQYNDVKRALDKIKRGSYGVCEIGGEKIETERLDANPAARTCLAHKDAKIE